MILFFVFLEAVLLSVEYVSLDTANKAKFILILLQFLLLFSDLSKFIDNDGTNDLIHDHFYDEKVAEIDKDVPNGDCWKVCIEVISIIESDKSLICFETDA